ncbi:FHA domain-containing protein [Microbacterium sp. zg.Y1090]|uniref:FHA domain-containing protein n=1 Tax=Microbacterium wangruii TaxID=3049073 RepID=UPI00214C0E14|nr:MULTISPECIES: FHA domain-containing protein [unclassified Microbacterium]MCR2818320.1 FHA domain-containing protein [Microbacterium sp. zg.Y1090]WIM29341.1 FHA domain-containing protein [Microbacterium sp. zg-Y1090]
MAEWSYSPGDLPAILGDDTAVLFAGARATPTARAVLAGGAVAGGWESAVDVIVRAGLAAAPHFVAAGIDGTSLTGVVRGSSRIVATHVDGRVSVLTGAAQRTWQEFHLTDVAAFAADAGDDAASPTRPAHPGPLAATRLHARLIPAPHEQLDPDLTLDFSDALFDLGAAPAVGPERMPAESMPAGRYDELFGATLHRAVEAAAVRPPEEDVLDDSPAGGARAGEDAPAPRAPRGAVVLPDGRVLPLTGTLLIGRSPRADGPDTVGLPTLVTIDDPDVSRTHLRVRVDDAHVLLEDLRSTNGTVFTAAGSGPRRLHPGETVRVTPGAVADLGGTRLVFEGVR